MRPEVGQRNVPVGAQVGRSLVPRSCCSVTGSRSITEESTVRSVSSPLTYVTLATTSAAPYSPAEMTL